MKHIKSDIEKMITKIEDNQDSTNGLVVVMFSADGRTFVDHSCTLNQLAIAIASLQAEYNRYYNEEVSLN